MVGMIEGINVEPVFGWLLGRRPSVKKYIVEGFWSSRITRKFQAQPDDSNICLRVKLAGHDDALR